MDNELKPFRAQIDAIDLKLLDLLNQRANLAVEIGKVKSKTNMPVFRPEREAQILRTLSAENSGPMPPESLKTIYREIISACRAMERRLVVSYLGPAGTFTEQAAYKYFGSTIDVLPCATLDDVFRAAEAGTVDFGIVPIENSTEGAINRTLDLLIQTSLVISGEISLVINHNLMTQSGKMDGVGVVYAHSHSLAQCQNWLNQHYPRVQRHAVSSNGEAAMIASKNKEAAAIAGELAGKRYDLKIVSAHIQDDPHNRTRFAIIGHQQTEPSGRDQTSLVLSVPNKAGAVYRLIEPLDRYGVSMARFESRPARSQGWEYFFFVDLEGHAKEEKVALALSELKDRSSFFKLLGTYSLSE
jgi:chorismate mutase/prephenate dehydratase